LGFVNDASVRSANAKLGTKADLTGMLRYVLRTSVKERVNDRYLENRQGCG
jgi:hypothetical protein